MTGWGRAKNDLSPLTAAPPPSVRGGDAAQPSAHDQDTTWVGASRASEGEWILRRGFAFMTWDFGWLGMTRQPREKDEPPGFSLLQPRMGR